jgi:hypothetical protein
MVKEVKISRSKSNFNLIIFNLLKSGKTIKEICKQLDMTKYAISYHLRLLKESGSIKKIGYGVWETLIYQEKQVKKIKVGHSNPFIKPYFENKLKNKEIRGHGFRFRIRLPKLYNWNRRIEFLEKNKIKFEVINKGFSQRIIFRDCKVWLSDHSIVVYFPKDLSFFGVSAKETEESAVFEIIEIMKGLDNLFHTSFKINKVYQIKIFGKHQANIRNALARMYNNDKRKLAVANSEGQWLLIDDSFNLNELETTGCNGKNDATKDMDDVIKPFFNSLKENPFTAYDFKNLFDLTSKAVENQDRYAENIELHLKAIQEIRDTLKDIRDVKK